MISEVLGRFNDPVTTRLYYSLLNFRHKTEFITIGDEVSQLRAWIATIPSDFDIVVGIPRSGLFTASLLSTEFGKPLSIPELIIQNKYWVTRTGTENLKIDLDTARLLLVDDSAGTGSSLNEAKDLILKHKPNVTIKTAVPWLSHKSKADYSLKHFPNDIEPTWIRSLMHNKYIPPIAFDFDGVLCMDYDGSDYLNFLINVKPYKIPIYEIDYIITGRKEFYRCNTELWLSQNKVKYKELHMCPNGKPTIDFKVEMIRKLKPGIFVESNPLEAIELHKRTGIRVISLGDEQLYG